MAQRQRHQEETQAQGRVIISIQHTRSRDDDTQEVPLVKNLSALPVRSEKEQAIERGGPAVWFTRWIRNAAFR